MFECEVRFPPLLSVTSMPIIWITGPRELHDYSYEGSLFKKTKTSQIHTIHR